MLISFLHFSSFFCYLYNCTLYTRIASCTGWYFEHWPHSFIWIQLKSHSYSSHSSKTWRWSSTNGFIRVCLWIFFHSLCYLYVLTFYTSSHNTHIKYKRDGSSRPSYQELDPMHPESHYMTTSRQEYVNPTRRAQTAPTGSRSSRRTGLAATVTSNYFPPIVVGRSGFSTSVAFSFGGTVYDDDEEKKKKASLQNNNDNDSGLISLRWFTFLYMCIK